jgi:hypothetical protein
MNLGIDATVWDMLLSELSSSMEKSCEEDNVHTIGSSQQDNWLEA